VVVKLTRRAGVSSRASSSAFI